MKPLWNGFTETQNHGAPKYPLDLHGYKQLFHCIELCWHASPKSHGLQKNLHCGFSRVTVIPRYLNPQCLVSSSHTRLGVENGVARTANLQSLFANTCLSVKNSRRIAHPGVLHRARFEFSSPSRAFSFPSSHPSSHSDNLLVEKQVADPVPSE